MGHVHVQTVAGEQAALADSVIDDLAASLRGKLLQPPDEDYESARRVYNAMIDKHPRLIAPCADVADVMTVVNFARVNWNIKPQGAERAG